MSSSFPVIVDATRHTRFPDARELWQYRSLIRLLAARDVKLRFRQTRFGVVWLVVNPLLFTVAYAFLFGGIGNIKVQGHSYFVFTYVGMSLWAAFNALFTRTCNCLLNNRELLTHAYFPRMSVPLASAAATQVDVLISWAILVTLLISDGTNLTARLALVPLWFLLGGVMATALGMLVASWTVAFRDLQNITALVLAAGPIITPVAYPASALPEKARFLATINPLTPIFDGMRASALGSDWPSAGALCYAVAATVGLSLVSLTVFRRVERRLADVI